MIFSCQKDDDPIPTPTPEPVNYDHVIPQLIKNTETFLNFVNAGKLNEASKYVLNPHVPSQTDVSDEALKFEDYQLTVSIANCKKANSSNPPMGKIVLEGSFNVRAVLNGFAKDHKVRFEIIFTASQNLENPSSWKIAKLNQIFNN